MYMYVEHIVLEYLFLIRHARPYRSYGPYDLSTDLHSITCVHFKYRYTHYLCWALVYMYMYIAT